MTPAAHERLLNFLHDRIPAGEKTGQIHEAAARTLRTPHAEHGPAGARRSDQEIQIATVALLALLDETLAPRDAEAVRDIIMPTTPGAAFDERCEMAADRAAVEFLVGIRHRENAHRACGGVLTGAEMLACDTAGDVYVAAATALGLAGARLRGLDRNGARAMFEIARRTGSPTLAMDTAAASDFAARHGIKRLPRVL